MYGILTYHDGYNFGTFLQVYSLQQKIKQLGYECCVINYKSLKFFIREYRALLYTRRPPVLFGNIRKALAFKREHRRLNLTARFMRPNLLDDLKLAGIVYGSDEIWNYENPAIGGYDSIYFGDHFSTGRRIAYAPSFGSLSLDSQILPGIRTLLGQFDHISVREIHSQKLVQKITGKLPPLVVDPTLLHDLRGEEYVCRHTDFIMVYTTGFPGNVQQELVQFARRRGLKLISVGYRQTFCDISEIALGPFDYLGYIKSADYVVTSMFHGVMLSLVYRKRLAVVVDPYRTNKLSTVMDTFKVRERLYRPGQLAAILDTDPDFAAIDQALSEGRDSSEAYLRKTLGAR